jgi:membrane protease YdiL (CAAX protease family)
MRNILRNIGLPILAALAGTIAVMSVQAGFVLLPAGWDFVYLLVTAGLVSAGWWRWQRVPLSEASPRRSASARVVVMGAICVNSIGMIHTHWVPLAETTVTTTALRSPWSVAATLIAAGLVAPLLEEALFRGYLLSRLRRSCSTVLSVILSAIVFAGVHDDPTRWVAQFASGILLACIVVQTGRMWLAVATHSAINLSGVLWGLAATLQVPTRYALVVPLLNAAIACVAALELRRVLLETSWRNARAHTAEVAPPATWRLDATG